MIVRSMLYIRNKSDIYIYIERDSIYIDKEPINLDNYKVPIHRLICKNDKNVDEWGFATMNSY